ncbi:MAG: DegT/DnrJ/EryC1/StrS family aminotransferase [Phycisphaerales bacterium]|nr:DegT/DnrJ/EryC1/StrS family aminotransferase [Phycisphaerales bacterium]
MSADHDPIPLLDLKAQYAALRDVVEPIMHDVADSQWFIGGPKLDAFEQAMADYCGTSHAVGCASGSDALLVSLMALDIGPGDEVICPSYTFFATAGSIWRLGARPVWVDIDPTTYQSDVQSITTAADQCSNLKAIMPVHLFGQACNMAAIEPIAEAHGVPIVEDAAQAIGCRDDRGRMAGSMGTTGCFSFFPSKNLGGFGDGGLITTNDADLAARMKRLRNHGMEPKYIHHEVGLNSRLDAMQAAVLHAKLPHLNDWARARQLNADDYDRMFSEAGAGDTAQQLSDCELPLLCPARPAAEQAEHIFNQYCIRVPATIRDALRAHLVEQKIGHEVYYPVPLHLQPCFESLGGAEGDLPYTEAAANESLALPIYAELTQAQKERIVTTVAAFVRANAPSAVQGV